MLLTSCFSLLASHFSLLTSHFSLLTSHRSLLTSHFSLLHYSLPLVFEGALRECDLHSRALLPRPLLEVLYLDEFWNHVAKAYPRWLAPNVITLLGGACVLAASLLSAWYSPALRGESPPWVFATNALLLFSYQTLDGSDGKQARRTNTGSPLGELFDHGVDAWAVGLITTFTVDAFAFGIESPWPWAILIGTLRSW